MEKGGATWLVDGDRKTTKTSLMEDSPTDIGLFDLGTVTTPFLFGKQHVPGGSSCAFPRQSFWKRDNRCHAELYCVPSIHNLTFSRSIGIPQATWAESYFGSCNEYNVGFITADS